MGGCLFDLDVCEFVGEDFMIGVFGEIMICFVGEEEVVECYVDCV